MTAISFCIPAKNEELLIGRCIKSIKAEIAATGVEAEIIVVDNGSTDSTVYVAMVNGAKVLRESRPGASRARQTGFEYSHYPLVAFIDADCMLRLGWIKCALGVRQWNKDVYAVSGPVHFYDAPFGNHFAKLVFRTYRALSRVMPVMLGGNVIIRRDALKAAGGWDSSIEFWGDDTKVATELDRLSPGSVHFDLGLVVSTSSRRLKEQGWVRTFVTYLVNYLAVRLTGAPAHREHRDVR